MGYPPLPRHILLLSTFEMHPIHLKAFAPVCYTHQILNVSDCNTTSIWFSSIRITGAVDKACYDPNCRCALGIPQFFGRYSNIFTHDQHTAYGTIQRMLRILPCIYLAAIKTVLMCISVSFVVNWIKFYFSYSRPIIDQ